MSYLKTQRGSRLSSNNEKLPKRLTEDVNSIFAPLVEFLHQPKRSTSNPVSAMSLFSGAGLSDVGYEQAGFKFYVQAELDKNRAMLCTENFPNCKVVVGELTDTWKTVVTEYKNKNVGQLNLLSVTPPCQGMSSSNPGRGKVTNREKRDKRNRLTLDAIPIAKALRPRIIVAENVKQVLKEEVKVGKKFKKLLGVFAEKLEEYQVFSGVVQMADYGIPQVRKRAIVVAIRRDEPCLVTLQNNKLLPWPKATHAENPSNGLQPWRTLKEWLEKMDYEALDAINQQTARSEDDAIHFVPSYEDEPDRYLWIADIPSYSGQNAYQNANCRSCNYLDVPEGVAFCSECNAPMRNRPYVQENGTFRLIKGFTSSYRRMHPDRPAQTVTTSSSHLGSDYKIHPWENRVLSIRECADLQTIPRFYDWSWTIPNRQTYLARKVIGEALPPWFTYLHGQVLRDLLANQVNTNDLAQA